MNGRQWIYDSGLSPAFCASMFSLWIALAVKGSSSIVETGAAFLFFFLVYTLDHLGHHPEDNHQHAAGFVKRHGNIFRVIFIVCVAAALLFIVIQPRLVFGFGVGFGLALFYWVPLPRMGKRIKELPYIKSFFGPAHFIITMCVFSGSWPDSAHHIIALAGSFVFLLVNMILYDLKDTQSDRAAGIRSIANSVPRRYLLPVLLVTLLIFGAVSTICLPFPASLASALGYLTLMGCIVWLMYYYRPGSIVIWGDFAAAIWGLTMWALS